MVTGYERLGYRETSPSSDGPRFGFPLRAVCSNLYYRIVQNQIKLFTILSLYLNENLLTLPPRLCYWHRKLFSPSPPLAASASRSTERGTCDRSMRVRGFFGLVDSSSLGVRVLFVLASVSLFALSRRGPGFRPSGASFSSHLGTRVSSDVTPCTVVSDVSVLASV